MRYQPPSWQSSPHPSHPHSNEIEHRLTVVETVSDHHVDKIESHATRLNIHEKAILAIGAVLQILMQDKYPVVAEFIKRALP